MPTYVIKCLESLTELRQTAPKWNDLWQRSSSVLPLARAEFVALWCETFASDRPFRALAIEQDGQWVAALPWIDQRRLGLSLSTLPGNHWSPGGELLIDPRADSAAICDLLVSGLARHARPLALFDAVPVEARPWQELLGALDRAGNPWVCRPRFRINRVELEGDWAAYWAGRSRNHRRHIRRSLARAEGAGPISLLRSDRLAASEVEPLLRTCFEMEARGWKGAAGGAVLAAPRVWQFYLNQARLLADLGQLRLSTLRQQDRPIAFEYGWLAKGVYATPKVAYDESFAAISPGQLLRHLLIEELDREGDVDQIDFFGPASDATSKWATGDFPVARVMVALHGVAARSAIAAYRHVWPLASKIVGRPCLPNAKPAVAAPNDDSDHADSRETAIVE